jgi:hypothetical protein
VVGFAVRAGVLGLHPVSKTFCGTLSVIYEGCTNHNILVAKTFVEVLITIHLITEIDDQILAGIVVLQACVVRKALGL